MKRILRIFLVLLFLILIPSSTKAQDIHLPYSVDSLKFQVDVDENLKYHIKQELNFGSFAPNSFSWILNSDKISNLQILKNNFLIDPSQYQTQKTDGKISILNLTNFGTESTWEISWTQEGEVALFEKFDEFRYQPVEEFGFNITNLEVLVNLPQKIDKKQINPIYYAIHGIESPEVEVLESKQIKYTASNLSPYASFTCLAFVPKGVFQISTFDEYLAKINMLGFNFWLGVIFAFPLITFFVILVMVYIRRNQENIKVPTKMIKNRPAKLSAPLVGVLFRQKIGPREIAAAVLNLAIEGYLIINEREAGYSFGERKEFEKLRPFQKAVAHELLKGGLRESLYNIKEQPKKELFSQSVSQIYDDIYSEIVKLGYFVQNPKVVSLRYKIFGIFLFFVSVIGFFLSPLIFPDIQYIIFAFLGVTIASLIVISLADTMPKRTKKGRKALANWLAFRKFLVEYPESVGFEHVHQDMFLKYLPYAVVLGVEKKWADHFTKVPMQVPDWYNSYRTIKTLPQFTKGLYPLVDDICKVMVSLKEPIL